LAQNISPISLINKKHTMKKIYLFTIFFGWITYAYGQQYVQYTQFMFNKIALNPAYAGSKEGPTFSTLYRTQWVHLNGAPVSQSFSVHAPILKDRVGIGLSVHHDKIGPSSSWFYNLQYAYRISLQKGHLSIGLQGLLRSYRVNWEAVNTIHAADPTYGGGSSVKFLPNVGVGVYYYTENLYTGFSMPRLLKGDLSFQEQILISSDYSLEDRKALWMLGGIIPIRKQLKIKADGLIKYIPNAPLDIDLHAGIVFLDLFNVGLTYRFGGITRVTKSVVTAPDGGSTPVPITKTSNSFGESLDFVLQILCSDNLKLGLAYDYNLSQVRDFNSGTYELMIEYTVGKKPINMSNPRFF